jgi:hypothetical protein
MKSPGYEQRPMNGASPIYRAQLCSPENSFPGGPVEVEKIIFLLRQRMFSG